MMRLRVRQWINTKTLKMRYGIQTYHEGCWLNVMEGGEPLFFRKKERAEAYVKRHGSK